MSDKIILNILKNRGIVEERDVEEFLSSKPKRTYDPFLLLNMKEGVDLILDSCKKNKKICLYGDYDSDGITSISILKSVMSHVSKNLIYFIPDRFKDGYGISKGALDRLKEENVDLIVTVDCGITAVEEVEYCKELGMDIIITDHHTPDNRTPDCLVINPKQDTCSYPFKDLAGCGVAFKVAQAIRIAADLPKSVVNHVLDIVAIGTIGDIVPLLDENRTIVKYGLQSIASKKKKGLFALSKLIGTSHIDSQAVSFGIVPHLNAAGRMKSAITGVKLFSSSEDEEAMIFAQELIELNNERKITQQQLFDKCKTKYAREYEDKKFPLILMDNAHEGITGIVAGKMKDFAKKPVAILTEDHSGDFFKGTSRGIENIDIYEILSKGKDKNLFEKFGGHKGACGFTITKENYSKLVDLVEREMNKFTDEELIVKPNYDCILDGKDINVDLVENLKVLEPFGHMNPKPIFKIENIEVLDILYMGTKEEHVKIKCIKDDKIFDIIAFHYESLINFKINKGDVMDVIGSLDVNTWKNKKSVQLLLQYVDLKI